MTEQEIYAEKIRELKRAKREEMVKALHEAGYSCNEIAVAFNLQESNVRSLVGRNSE